MRLEFERVHIDHDLPVAPAEGLRHGGAGDVGHLVAHGVLAEIPQLRLVHVLALEGDEAHGQARRTGSATLAAAFRSDGGRLARLQVAENVFQHDDRVVNQAGKSQRQTAEHHGVYRVVASRERDERRQRRERNGKKHRHRRPEAAEKNQDHRAGQDQSDCAFVDEVLDGVFDEHRLIEHNFSDQPPRHVEQVSDGTFDSAHDGKGVRLAPLFQHRQIYRRLAVHAHDVVLELRSVPGIAHVRHEHRRIAEGFQRQPFEVIYVVELAVRAEVVIERPGSDIPRRENKIGLVHGTPRP